MGVPNTTSVLTDIQKEVLACFALGGETIAIAEARGCSPKTVEYHRACIKKILGLESIADLTHWAIGMGLVELKYSPTKNTQSPETKKSKDYEATVRIAKFRQALTKAPDEVLVIEPVAEPVVEPKPEPEPEPVVESVSFKPTTYPPFHEPHPLPKHEPEPEFEPLTPVFVPQPEYAPKPVPMVPQPTPQPEPEPVSTKEELAPMLAGIPLYYKKPVDEVHPETEKPSLYNHLLDGNWVKPLSEVYPEKKQPEKPKPTPFKFTAAAERLIAKMK
jgi:DNA-binding CsgD family transcriptional regulator